METPQITPRAEQFLKELHALCRRHQVELAVGNRFWVFQPGCTSAELIGLVDHSDPSVYDEKTKQMLVDSGRKPGLVVTQVTYGNLSVMAGARKLLGDINSQGRFTIEGEPVT